MARPIAPNTMMTRKAAKIQAASNAIALLIPGPAGGARQDWSPAARSTAREYLTSRGSCSPDGNCPASESAESSRARAAATSTWEPSSAWRTRIETRSSATERNPLLTAARTSLWPSAGPPSTSRIRTRLSSARMPTTGGCPVRMPRSPSRVLAITILAIPDQISPSGATRATRTVTSPARLLPHARRSLPLQLRGLALGVLDPAAHEERLLGEAVVLALGQPLERGHRVRQGDEHARLAGELLGDEHRVREEPLDPAGPLDRDLVLLGQLVDAQDGDDVLEFLVALQDPLHLAGNVVVLLPDVLGVQDAGGGVERVDRREDALLGDRPGQHRGRVQVGERGVRGRVGDVVGRHVDGLHRGDRVTPGGGDPLLELAHLVGERGLVPHRRGHPAEQGGHLRTGLGEPEDVVDEQQHVLALHITEVLRHGQR